MAKNNDKYFKSLDEQVDYLVETKNIKRSEVIEKVLSERSYSSIINPYKRLFARGKNTYGHLYYQNVDFDNYIKIAALDDYCSQKIFEWIGIFERRLKVTIAYIVSERLFNNGDKDGISYVSSIEELIETVKLDSLVDIGIDDIGIQYTESGRVIADSNYVEYRKNLLIKKIYPIGSCKTKSKNSLVRYYQNKYSKVPFWLLIHELTFGELKALYDMFVKEIKDKIYCRTLNVSSKVSAKKLIKFSGKLEKIRELRNTISHFESLFSYLDNLNKNNYSQVVESINLLKTVAKNSIIATTPLPNFDNFVKSEYNQKSYKRYQKILDIVEI